MFGVALLAACVTRGPFVAASLGNAPASIELTATPFFPQDRYQCGPAALATVLVASNSSVTPEALTPFVYIPARKGSLQLEMQAAPRSFGRLTYVLAPRLDAILAELAAARPVLVLHNYGVPFFPRWHYAVVIGYDASNDTLLLRSGIERRQVQRAAHFLRAWDNGGRWAMVVLRAGEIAASAESPVYLRAAADFERVAAPEESRLAFDAAVRRWPAEPLAWIGRGTALYRSGDLAGAARDYARALELDEHNAGARNNLAQTLLELGCPRSAGKQLARIDVDAIGESLRIAVLDTRERVSAAADSGARLDAARCPPAD